MAVFSTGNNNKQPKKFGEALNSKINYKKIAEILKSKKFLVGSAVSIFLIVIVAGSLFYFQQTQKSETDDRAQQTSARGIRFDPDNVSDLAGSYNKRCAYQTEEVKGVCNLNIKQNGEVMLTLPDDGGEHKGKVELRKEGDNLFNIYWEREGGAEAMTIVEAKREGTTIKMYYQSGEVFGFNTF